ncbi:MAG TPA: peptidylprolyl isomerase [Acidobacteriota bacterium]|nr:peptidylprolyl isomerase [Acidobacteriota bacterium]
MKAGKVLSAVLFMVFLSGVCLSRPAGVFGSEEIESDIASQASELKEILRAGEVTVSSEALYPEVVATVNERTIYGRDLEFFVRRELAAIGSPAWKDLREDYKQELTVNGLATLINLQLLYQAAVAEGIKPDKAAVETEIKRISGEFETEAEFLSAMAQQGVDPEVFERHMLVSSTVSLYIAGTVRKGVTVTQQEIEEYYKQRIDQFAHPEIVRASHILLSFGATDEENAGVKRLAEELLAKVGKGEDFAQLAARHSADESSSLGGDLGYIARDDGEPAFTEALFAMQVGESRIVQSRFGLHVVKVTSKKNEGVMTLDDVKAELTEFIKDEKVQQELDRLLMEMVKTAKITVFLE